MFSRNSRKRYCVVDGERYEIFIDVIVVADMSYLHKYLRRGGGSHSCTHFCFLCSVSSKYRQEGYAGGCLKCRQNDVVYNDLTGCQQCRNHDVCDPEFLEWEDSRMRYLEANVKPKIPSSNRPYYESLESLREECMKKCVTEREQNQVMKKKTFAVLEKGLLEEGRTRVGCDLSCNVNVGVRICPVALVIEDLRLRCVPYLMMTEIEQRHALEMLL